MNKPNPNKYLHLLKRELIDLHHADRGDLYPLEIAEQTRAVRWLKPLDRWLRRRNFRIVKQLPGDAERRRRGGDWPARALTMIGLQRLDHLESCIAQLVAEAVPGDVFQCGVWRGGAGIFLRAVMDEFGWQDRRLWLADSFAGFPLPDTLAHPEDRDSHLHAHPILRVPLSEVQANFRKYDLNHAAVEFVAGWFEKTLPQTTCGPLALLHIDADLYASTELALRHLYPRLSTGGIVIVDDYNAFPYCKAAVDDYREANGILEPIQRVDEEAVCWQKEVPA